MPVPIEDARNLGPVTGRELRSVGIATRERLQELGWEESMMLLVERFPERIHTLVAYALLGAVEDLDWRALSPAQRAKARAFVARLRR